MTDISKETAAADSIGFDSAVAKTEEDVRRYLKGAPPVIRHLTTHLAKATGKMIRAQALLACALQKDGRINPDAVKAAAAVELLHLATLVHDDIIDDAAKRRGIDALHRKFGEKMAVLCGDYLFCTGLDLVSSISVLENRKETADRNFPKYLSDVCLGEIHQNQNLYNYRLSENAYFKIIGGKTAALFEACFYSGFMFSDEPDSFKESYMIIGNNIGQIFQLCDDCADYEATQKQTKKPVLSDFSRGVITLPLIYALKKDKTLQDRIAEGIEPRALKAAVEAAGGLDYTHHHIDGLYKKTKKLIESLDIGTDKEDLLTRILKKSAGVTD